MTVEMVDKKGPHFPNRLQSPTDSQYEAILRKKVDVAAELDYVCKAITMTRHKLKGRVPLFGFCGSPWTLLCYMVEGGGSKLFVQTKTWIYKYPQESKDLLRKIAEICVEYLALQIQAGAQVCFPLFGMKNVVLKPSRLCRFLIPGLLNYRPRLLGNFHSRISHTSLKICQRE